MALSFNRPRFLSRPITVLWAGWESNTARLQQAGWSLAAEQDIAHASLRLALHHRGMQCYAISSPLDFRFERYIDEWSREPPPVAIQYFASKAQLQIIESGPLAFEPIDAAPQFIDQEIRNIEDLRWFSVPMVRTEEIIAEPHTVAEMLAKIREMQAPEQARLREKQTMQMRRDEYLDAIPREHFHAQIVTLADYRKAA